MFPLNFFKVNAKLPIAYLIYVLPKSESDSVLKRKLKSLLHEIFNKIFAPSDPKMSTFCFMFGSETGLCSVTSIMQKRNASLSNQSWTCMCVCENVP